MNKVQNSIQVIFQSNFNSISVSYHIRKLTFLSRPVKCESSVLKLLCNSVNWRRRGKGKLGSHQATYGKKSIQTKQQQQLCDFQCRLTYYFPLCMYEKLENGNIFYSFYIRTIYYLTMEKNVNWLTALFRTIFTYKKVSMKRNSSVQKLDCSIHQHSTYTIPLIWKLDAHIYVNWYSMTFEFGRQST